MEENIKILKKIREESINAAANACTGAMSNIWRKEAQAIENLLKRYKELEEGCKTCVIRKDLNEYVENSVPISVIQNTLDDIDRELEAYKKLVELGKETDCEYYDNVANLRTKQVLKEILEKGNK